MDNSSITRAARIVETEILAMQNNLVSACFATKIFSTENTQITSHLSKVNENNAFINIKAWCLVTERLGERLKNHKQVIITNKYGVWWGRINPYDKLAEDPIIQLIAKDIVDEFATNNTKDPVVGGVMALQGPLVNECIWRGLFKQADISNYYQYIDREGIWLKEELISKTKKSPGFNERYFERLKITYGWFLVEEWIAEFLEMECEPILKNEYGTWWGKTNYTRELANDPVLKSISKKIFSNSIIG